MAQCAYCKADTSLYEGGVPICVKCAETRGGGKRQSPATDRDIRAILVKHIVEATERANAASAAFNAVLDRTPSGLPHPDGTQRIRNASRDLDSARREMMKAHTRLNEFIERGVVPEDLKQGNGS
jgi:hypothetical protein